MSGDYDADFTRITRRLDALEANGLPQNPNDQLRSLLRDVVDEIAALRAEVAPMLDAYKKHVEYQAQHGLDPWQSGSAPQPWPAGTPGGSDASGGGQNERVAPAASPGAGSQGT